MRCRASLRFTVTYHFGHRTCNSEPILLKIVSKDAHFLGVYYGMLNRFEPVFIGPVRGGFYRFLFSKGSNCNRSGPVQIGSVRSGFGLFPVHRTGPSNTNGMRIVPGSYDNSVRVWDVSMIGCEHFVWNLADKNWIISSQGQDHLMWVPQEANLVQGFNILIISSSGFATVDFHQSMIGVDWVHCYTPTYSIV